MHQWSRVACDLVSDGNSPMLWSLHIILVDILTDE